MVAKKHPKKAESDLVTFLISIAETSQELMRQYMDEVAALQSAPATRAHSQGNAPTRLREINLPNSSKAAVQKLTEALGGDGVSRVLGAAANALRALPRDDEEQARLSRVAGIEPVGEAEAAEIAARVTVRSMEMRKALLGETVSSATAAEILGVSAQTVRNRMQQGKLLAVRDRGDYRFPLWQFDTGGDDGVIRGLPRVLQVLDVPPISKLS